MPALLRPLTRSDLDFAHGLSRLAGWNQTHRDWERFLSLAPEGCFLAEKDGQPAGTTTTTSEGTHTTTTTAPSGMITTTIVEEKSTSAITVNRTEPPKKPGP
jgi:hypothetical protein